MKIFNIDSIEISVQQWLLIQKKNKNALHIKFAGKHYIPASKARKYLTT
jgi:hypothetical protein